MSKRDLMLLLEDMLESALKIKKYTANLDMILSWMMIEPLMQLLGILKL